MKKTIIILILLTALLFPKTGLASSDLEIQILKTRIQILELQIQYLITLLAEINLVSENQQIEIKEIETKELKRAEEIIKPILEKEVKEEIKHKIIPLLELECKGWGCS